MIEYFLRLFLEPFKIAMTTGTPTDNLLQTTLLLILILGIINWLVQLLK